MARRSLDNRRSEYLEIGAAIIAESLDGTGKDPALALSHVKMADVAERAGVTKSALYHIWESQEAFWHDLLGRLLEASGKLAIDYFDNLVARETSDLPGVPTLFDHADALFITQSVSPARFARIGLLSYLADDGIREQFDHDYKAALEGYRHSVELAIMSAGRRLKDGFDIDSILVTVDALLEGLCLANRVSEESTPSVTLTDGSEATLYSVALEAIILGYTEPNVTGAPEDAPVGVLADIGMHLFRDGWLARSIGDESAVAEFWRKRADNHDMTVSDEGDVAGRSPGDAAGHGSTHTEGSPPDSGESTSTGLLDGAV